MTVGILAPVNALTNIKATFSPYLEAVVSHGHLFQWAYSPVLGPPLLRYWRMYHRLAVELESAFPWFVSPK